MTALMYLLQVNLYLLLFYVFYYVVLRNETFFKMNRFYLVGSAVLSLIIPVLKGEWIRALFISEKVQMLTQTLTTAVIDTGAEQFNISPEVIHSQSILPTPEWLWLIYAGVSMVFLLNFLRRLYRVNKVFEMNIKGRAFSFFSRIAVDEELEGKDTIISHELVHARQWHSADVIFFEIFLAFNWFNPVAYLYRNSIKNIHEFIADDSAASTLEERSAYALLLVSNVFNTQPQKLTNNFFNQSLLKRRIIMLHKTKSRKIAILKYGLSAPLLATMLIISSATGADIRAIEMVKEKVHPLIEQLEIAKPATAVMAKLHVPAVMTEPTDTTKKAPKTNAASKNLYDYVGKLYDATTMTKVGKEGNIYVSFDVGENKRPTGFEIMKSIGSDWEKDLIEGLKDFPDTVDMPTGKYHFSLGFAYGGNEDLVEINSTDPATIFRRWRVVGPAVGTATEMEEGNEVHNTYVSFTTLPEPLIVVDEKEVNYISTKMGLKLAESIYPKVSGTSKALRGDKAVALYGERARNGIIVIETKEKDY